MGCNTVARRKGGIRNSYLLTHSLPYDTSTCNVALHLKQEYNRLLLLWLQINALI